MPFTFIRNDITKVQADALVNTANPAPVVGSGVDSAIHTAAGPQLLAARQKIGPIAAGQSALTPAYHLPAQYVIHTVSPIWKGGQQGEAALLGQCYAGALQLAFHHQCKSIAFPLLATGNYGFPRPLAIQIAVQTFSQFLLTHEMDIYLVVFDHKSMALSEKLFSSIKSYIDDTYAEAHMPAMRSRCSEFPAEQARRFRQEADFNVSAALEETAFCCNSPTCTLESLLEQTDDGFSQTLLRLIDQSGRKDSDVYKAANIDRKLFSKIRSNPGYKPTKETALAFAIALRLDLSQTKDFLQRAGYALSHSSKMDIIVEYCILHNMYDIHEINDVLFHFDQKQLGARTWD